MNFELQTCTIVHYNVDFSYDLANTLKQLSYVDMSTRDKLISSNLEEVLSSDLIVENIQMIDKLACEEYEINNIIINNNEEYIYNLIVANDRISLEIVKE